MPPKLAPYVKADQQALLTDARRPNKERCTAKALHAQLVAAGYAGGRSRLTDCIRAWRAERGWVRFYSMVDVVILDELGYLPFSQVGGALLSDADRTLNPAPQRPIRTASGEPR